MSVAVRLRRRHLPLALSALVAAAALAVPSGILAQPAQTSQRQLAAANDASNRVWSFAQHGKPDQALAALIDLTGDDAAPSAARLRESSSLLTANIEKRESLRAEKAAEVDAQLDASLAEEQTPRSLSAALKSAIELNMLRTEKSALLEEPRIVALIADAERAASAAEARGEWLVANELYYRLSLLLDEQGKFRDDVKRLGYRLSMIRLFVPQRLWELRNNQRLAEGKPALPPYNALGEDYREKLAGISTDMVRNAVVRAIREHVERATNDPRDMLIGGLETIRTLITTSDLYPVFPGIADDQARKQMLGYVDAEIRQLRERPGRPGFAEINSLFDGLLRANSATVKLPEAAVLREFGDGAFSRLDEFSAIIWPDEFARFNRMTQGQFFGVGVQIQLDEPSQMIKVVTPLEGTPAFRAGIRAGDLIKKIEGNSAVGLSLNQAVELITGQPGTKVRMTMEREGDDLDFELVRANIPLRSVKGWKRTGAREDQWDWFIDPESKIGYVRLTQFAPNTTRELVQALDQMQAAGLRGLILDLRFNPGGLLTQAVSVANTFIDSGTIVSTEGTTPSQREVARASNTRIRNVPIAVLINEGSASASEIVSGAIKHYADQNQLRALLIGDRSFGKGSVQNVYEIADNAMLKLTTQYYMLPSGKRIHRLPVSTDWGVSPHVRFEMLPSQIDESLRLRQEADVVQIDQSGAVVDGTSGPAPNPQRLLDEGLDLQLQYALVLLQTQTLTPAERADAVVK